MSISLKQLTAMANISEVLAIEMRELIALRLMIAKKSAEQSRRIVLKSGSEPLLNVDLKQSGRVLGLEVEANRSSVTV